MTASSTIATRHDYHTLNAQLNLFAQDGSLQLAKDREAVAAYMREHVAAKTREYASQVQRVQALIAENFYERHVFEQYSPDFLERMFTLAESFDHSFQSFLGAFKFYTSYVLKTRDGETYLEGYAERVVATALFLGRGDEALAGQLVEEMMSGRFQPATPTFLNAGKAQRGELVSCFLLRVEDNLESIGRSVNSALQLSKRGGGVALLLSNLRERGAPIKQIENQSSGVVPVMKILEDSFSYANQLGARQGAGAVYLHAHHPDIMRFLDTKRENADEKIRIKTLSLGVVIPDITFELAKRGEKMQLFSPYDVFREYGKELSDIGVSEHYEQLCANPRIKKTEIDARDFFKTLAELQFESGYPYLLFEDTANRTNPVSGWINMSNLCSEILQPNTRSEYDAAISYTSVGNDISCNLGSLNIALTMREGNLARTVETAVRALTSVSEQTDIAAVPSIAHGNEGSHAIGLGQMNLHGFLASEHIHYGSAEAIDFTSVYFANIAYHALVASNRLAVERQNTFAGFERSSYADGSFFDKYVNRDWLPETSRAAQLFEKAGIKLATRADWAALRDAVMRHGIFNAYLQAVPPTGSISYVNNSTASIHPIAAKVEIRKEGRLGRVYFPAPHMCDENIEFFEDSYELGWQKTVDTYAAATQHVDQGLSLTLFFKDTATTRDINKAQIYAWRKGIKTIYYIRLRQKALSGTEVENCVSCAL